MESKDQIDLRHESAHGPLDEPDHPPPQYSELEAPPPRAYPAWNSHLQVGSNTGSDMQRMPVAHVANNPEDRRRQLFDPQEPSTWRGAKWKDIKQQWKERHSGPREPRDPWTGRGLYTGLTLDELKAKCENYGTLLPKGQRRR
jgi:hypothetical protein